MARIHHAQERLSNSPEHGQIIYQSVRPQLEEMTLNSNQLICRLCEIVQKQSRIIVEQRLMLEMHEAFDLEEKRSEEEHHEAKN
jgi:hypothetical protein